MPKQKIRAQNKFCHYRSTGQSLHPKMRKIRWGTGVSNVKSARISPYMGSRITPETRNEYIAKQKELYKEKYLRTTDEDKYVDDDTLEFMAVGYARFQANKEQKHYKAWLKNKVFFKYKGQAFPVLTEDFLQAARSLKDIENIKDNDG